MILPSICYETFGLIAIEAFACGKPVVASRLGGIATIIEDNKTGLLFEPGDPADLGEKVCLLMEKREITIDLGKAARAKFEANYTADKNYETLMNIYETAVTISKFKKRI